ncbi:site-specific DNA-methyltransferase [Candidatus Bathyarchaeota archaeon]|nr:site-specific DNA-methyltransferase [Candidatus Bathyarchaeota archaeon]
MNPCMRELEVDGQVVFFDSAENMHQIESGTITLVITSPPYWNVRDYGDAEQIGFNQSYDEYIASMNRVWEECIRVLRPNGKIAVNVQPLPISSKISRFGRRFIQNIMHDIEKFMRNHDMFMSGMHYWDKAPYINNVSWGSYPKPTNIASNTSFEQIFVWVKEGKTRKIPKEIMEQNLLGKQEWRHWAVRCIWDDIAPVIKINTKGENLFGHSAPFPEDIPYRMIRMHTVKGEKVLDPFLGSGTTLKVCRLTGRKGIGYEINEEYRDKIRERIKETWDPPFIDDGYLTIGYRTINKIIRASVEEIMNEGVVEVDPGSIISKVHKLLEKKGIISPALRRKLKSLLQEEENA